MNSNSKTISLVIIITLSIALTSCAPGPNSLVLSPMNGSNKPAGFWYGLWHGSIAPITFVVSLFNENMNIYETNNNGGWYNFGYLLGVGAFTSSASSSTKNTNKTKIED
jgi:hypothetical protein